MPDAKSYTCSRTNLAKHRIYVSKKTCFGLYGPEQLQTQKYFNLHQSHSKSSYFKNVMMQKKWLCLQYFPCMVVDNDAHPNELNFWLHKKTNVTAGTRISSDFGAKKQFWAYFNGQLHIFKHIHWLKLINNVTSRRHDLKVSDKFELNLKVGHGELRRSKKANEWIAPSY